MRKYGWWMFVLPALLAGVTNIGRAQTPPDEVTEDEEGDPLKVNLPIQELVLPTTARVGDTVNMTWRYHDMVRDDQEFVIYTVNPAGELVMLGNSWQGKSKTSHVLEFGGASTVTVGVAERINNEIIRDRGLEATITVAAGGGAPPPATERPPPPPAPTETPPPPAPERPDPAPAASRTNNAPRNLEASVTPDTTLNSGERFNVNFRVEDDPGDTFTSKLRQVFDGKPGDALPDDDNSDYSIAAVASFNRTNAPLTMVYRLEITDAAGASIEAEFNITVNPERAPPPDLPAGSVRLTLRRPSGAAEARAFRERNGEPEPSRGTATMRAVMRDGRLLLVPDEELTPAERRRLLDQYRRSRR